MTSFRRSPKDQRAMSWYTPPDTAMTLVETWYRIVAVIAYSHFGLLLLLLGSECSHRNNLMWGNRIRVRHAQRFSFQKLANSTSGRSLAKYLSNFPGNSYVLLHPKSMT